MLSKVLMYTKSVEIFLAPYSLHLEHEVGLASQHGDSSWLLCGLTRGNLVRAICFPSKIKT